MTTNDQQSPETQVSQILRDLSGIDDAKARSIVDQWIAYSGHPELDWQPKDVIDTIVELRRVSETDRSLEFDALFRAAASFPAPQVRLESVRALANGGSISIAQTLVTTLERDEVPAIRATAAQALHAFADPSQARNVSRMTIEQITTSLVNAIHIDEPIVRGKALVSLAALRYEDVPDLIDTMFDEAIGDSAMMSDVLAAMGETGDRSWLPAIEDAFYSSDPQIRISAILAFGSIANDDDVESLSEPFDDHVLEVQMATVKALENIATQSTTLDPRASGAREMLALAVASSEPEVQQLAQAALDTLKADDDLIYAVSPTMVERGLFGVPASATGNARDLSRYDAPTEEGWANVTSEGQELDVPETPEDIGEDYEDYLESDEFFKDSNTN